MDLKYLTKKLIEHDLHYSEQERAAEVIKDLVVEFGMAKVEGDRLRGFAQTFGLCQCRPGMCDTKSDFQCRAREALTGVSNQQEPRKCQKCGSLTGGEEALVDGQTWCHPCADQQTATEPK